MGSTSVDLLTDVSCLDTRTIFAARPRIPSHVPTVTIWAKNVSEFTTERNSAKSWVTKKMPSAQQLVHLEFRQSARIARKSAISALPKVVSRKFVKDSTM